METDFKQVLIPVWNPFFLFCFKDAIIKGINNENTN